MDDDYFVCLGCGDDEEPNPRSRRHNKELCVRCNRWQRQAWRYGLTIARFNAILRVQEWTCALCQEQPDCEFDYLQPDKPTFWQIDHDHSCCDKPSSCGKCVRGILCRECNTSRLPFYERLPDVLQDSVRFNDYLNSPPARRPEAEVIGIDKTFRDARLTSLMDAFFGL
ncbi:endonuclease domain-containing protein [Streptomyces sp. NPDC001312]|uniref:endonuclease domain-containing protein n=1 Tax=Streptomyces sp. NPDC001312 TaxID=3364561 RepID=UPI003674ABFB